MRTIIQVLVFIVGGLALALYGVFHVRKRVPIESRWSRTRSPASSSLCSAWSTVAARVRRHPRVGAVRWRQDDSGARGE